MKKICIYCNNEFTTSHTSKNHCSSPTCKEKYHHEKSYVKSICPICNTTFEHKKSKSQKYCSKKCAMADPNTKEKIINSQKSTYIKKYGVDHPMKTIETMNTFKNSMIKKYGTEHALQNLDILNKLKTTTFDKYGVTCILELEHIKKKAIESTISKKSSDKRKETIHNKYGKSHFSKTELFKNKMYERTFNKLLFNSKFDNFKINFDLKDFDGIDKKYSFICNSCNTEYFFDLKPDTTVYCKKCNPASERVKQTKKEKYGDENYNNLKKIKETNFKKYNSEYYTQSDLYKNTRYTKTFNKLNNIYDHISPNFSFAEFKGVSHENKYEFICNYCNKIFVSDIDDGKIPKCPYCSESVKSKYEIEILKFIKKRYEGKIIHNDRTELNGLEIDIFLPEINIGIEFNGLYWHSEISGNKNRNYHLSKTKLSEARGIKLIHIFEYEWINKKDIVKSILSNIILKSNKKIYARKCQIKEIAPNVKNKFMIENHIQGKDISKINLGLFYENKLISSMTFAKSRFNKNIEWEISRYVTKKNHIIIGGANKLFKYFVKKYNPNSIITYADRRYFNGNVYLNLGFEFMENTKPNYFYIKNGTIYNRIQFQKHKLNKLLNEYNETLTEWENMQLNGYDRIWDCGNKKFIWKK